MADDRTHFRYLNRESRWLDFSCEGLERCEDGALRLAALPKLRGSPSAELEALPAPEAPAGIAVDMDGSVYFSDPDGNRVLRVGGCDGQVAPVPCLGAGYDGETRCHEPRGLLIPPHRRVLIVADSGNHRVQLFDLDSWQLLEVWGQRPSGGDQPGSAPGRFDTPWAAAADAEGGVYVVDYGNRRVQKFGLSGDVDPSFWDAAQASGLVTRPADVAVQARPNETWVYVLDAEQKKIFVFDAGGSPRKDAAGNPFSVRVDSVERPMGLAATPTALYLGDNQRRTVVKFDGDGTGHEVGTAFGYHGPVAALALGGKGQLFAHAGTSLAPATLALDAAHRASGLMWSKAIAPAADKVAWYRLGAEGLALPPAAHVQFFVRTADQPDDPEVRLDSDDPFPVGEWRRQEIDVTDFYLGGPPARHLWVGARFMSDGTCSPSLAQMRVEFNHSGYADYLPAIYRERAPCGDFLTRLLALFESFLAGSEHQIAELPTLFDAASVPKEFLPWLAGWLALELDEDWQDDRKRQAIAEAFGRYARRGTAEGLRESLRSFARVTAVIQEPILNAAWWALPGEHRPCCGAAAGGPAWSGGQDSVLGFTTMLAPANPQGAVLGTTAVLDQSRLIAGDEFGTPLFEDVAHQFTVQVYRGEVSCAEKLAEVRTILEREKPAHTAAHLCIVEPRMRVGLQATVGVDAVVAGAPAATTLGDGTTGQLVLGGTPRGRIGQQSRVGTTTRL